MTKKAWMLCIALCAGCAGARPRWEKTFVVSYQASPEFMPKDQVKVSIEIKMPLSAKTVATLPGVTQPQPTTRK